MVNKITEDSIIPMIISGIPAFKSYYDKEIEYWGEDTPTGCQVGWFAHFIAEIFVEQKKEPVMLQQCFDLIEKLLVEGDEQVKNYMYFFFIESLVNIIGHEGIGYEVLLPYLGPYSKKALNKINAFWLEGKIIEEL